MGFFMRLKNWCARTFYGCHGIDALGKLNFAVVFILIILLNIALALRLEIFAVIVRILYYIALVVFVFRVFSKNSVKRNAENYKYVNIKSGVKDWFRLQKNRINDRKTHVYRKCPKCRAVLRLKRVKGKHRAACPRCGNSFEVKV